MEKRVSCRAIIIKDDKLVTMYREKNGRNYYTFPGGGIEENETEQNCVKRECFEEFGIIAEPIKKLYVLEDEKTIQNFYLCDWTAGELGTGNGEEFSRQNSGTYLPTLLDISKVNSLPLVPDEIKNQFLSDYNDKSLYETTEVKSIKSTFNG